MKKSLWTVTFLLVILLASQCKQGAKSHVSADQQREYANALYNRELYAQSIAEYQRYLDTYSMDANEEANIQFIIGNIYFDRLHDYENAMARYLMIKHVFPDSPLQNDAAKKVIECLERLQRSADAKQALDEATSLDPSQVTESRPGEVIAKIGNKEITTGDFDFQISQLPDYVQSQIKDKKSKRQFLQQYIGTELFYDAAKRQGLENDKEVIEGAFQAKKGLMVQKYLEGEIQSQVQIKPEDVELYFKANADQYAEKDDKGNVKRQKTFSEAGQQAAQDLARERQQKAYGELLQRMMGAEKVVIFDDKL